MKKLSFIIIFISLFYGTYAQQDRFDPPWNHSPESKVMFTIPGIDNVPDLFGDINKPQLVVFFAGNQFMCVDSIVAAFKKEYPAYKRIFVETLPPGILAKQISGGTLTIGNERISLRPDIYTAGKNRMDQMMHWVKDTVIYAHNKLAIMVQHGNPYKVKDLKDLGQKEIKVSMPNPAWEGIGTQIAKAYIKAGGEELNKMIMEEKVQNGTTLLTKIHHRESPINILNKRADAAPVWFTEGYYQEMLGHPVQMVQIPEKENIRAAYVAGILKNAPHPKAARDFLKFLSGNRAKEIYAFYGFEN
ncbi:MAG TPA: substrate-binding domain-containing protein [Arachidicoccus soli]|nr:substrate-binding domain-containing protein [Arachidicoccus soli]